MFPHAGVFRDAFFSAAKNQHLRNTLVLSVEYTPSLSLAARFLVSDTNPIFGFLRVSKNQGFLDSHNFYS